MVLIFNFETGVVISVVWKIVLDFFILGKILGLYFSDILEVDVARGSLSQRNVKSGV